MKNYSILIISNSAEKGNIISKKLKLLRENDTINIVSYIKAISILNNTLPNIILIYCSNSDSLDIVKEIRLIKSLDKIPILFIADTFDEEKALYAFDSGIDEFVFLDEPDSIILMRMLLTLQKSVLYKQIDMDNKILIEANLIDKRSGVYKKEAAEIVLKNFFTQSIEENIENTVFMYLKPVSTNGKRINLYKVANAIKKTLRGNDIITYGRASGFYTIIYNSDKAGIQSLFNRISNTLNPDCEIFACASEIISSFENMEPILYEEIKEQINTKNNFNYLNNLNSQEPVNNQKKETKTGKNIKELKKEFIHNLEQIIAPVFYRMQTTYTEKISDAEIKYILDENESKFIIKGKENTSELGITYPTFMKIITDIKHFPKNHQPKVKRYTFDFEEFSEEKLTVLLEELIKEYLNNMLLDKLYAAE